MKSFFNHTLLILAVITICSLAILFRSQLLAGYEKTQISIPAEKAPSQTVPVPASIRSYKSEISQEKRIYTLPVKEGKPNWRASNLSDFADAPSTIRDRIKENIERGTKGNQK